MYNDREKLTHHRRLFKEEFAEVDLEFLRAKYPRHPRLEEFSRSPRRHASDILLALLDVASWDDIVQNRFKASVPEETGTTDETGAPEETDTTEETEAPEETETPEETEAPEEKEAPKKTEKKSSKKKKSSQA